MTRNLLHAYGSLGFLMTFIIMYELIFRIQLSILIVRVRISLSIYRFYFYTDKPAS